MNASQTAVASTLCELCAAGPRGEAGHPHLRLYVGGPYPGHHIFRCGSCNDRWIRHYGDDETRYAWTRHAEKFPASARKAMPTQERGKAFPF